jgi:hypothetical protein
MDQALQKYYEDRLSMMGEPAWVQLMEDVQEMVKSTDTLSSVQDEKTLHFRKGELSILNWLLNIKDISDEAYEALKLEDAGL